MEGAVIFVVLADADGFVEVVVAGVVVAAYALVDECVFAGFLFAERRRNKVGVTFAEARNVVIMSVGVRYGIALKKYCFHNSLHAERQLSSLRNIFEISQNYF